MVESVIIIISCYLISGLMVHLVYSWLPQMRGMAEHYVLVTHNNEHQAEFVLRAITWYSRLRGKESRISVIDQSSSDQTVRIIKCLDREGQVQLHRTRSWPETERLVKDVRRSVKIAGTRDGSSRGSGKDGHPQAGDQAKVTVIYVSRQEDHVKIPLFH